MNESAAYRAEAAEKAVWKAVWKCIVDASSMNVVLSGPEYKAAMRDYRVAVEAAERARIVAAVKDLRVSPTGPRDENAWQIGFRQSRNETVSAVLDIIEGETK